MPQQINIIAFPGGFNLPLWAGQSIGSYARRGFDLRLTYTGSSVEQITGLVKGEFQIGLTGFDNVVAYQEGQGEASLDRIPDLFAFMGGDDAFLCLVAHDGISGMSDLIGRKIGVDAMTTGFAFVVREMLSRAGISEKDLSFEKVGGVKERFEALLKKQIDATLLLTPFELIGELKGCRVLCRASDILDEYQGVVGAASRQWAQTNAKTLSDFIVCYKDGLNWLFDPINSRKAVELLMERVPGMDESLASKTLSKYLDAKRGFERSAKLNPAGMETVLRLRSKFSVPPKDLKDPMKYVDESYYHSSR